MWLFTQPNNKNNLELINSNIQIYPLHIEVSIDTAREYTHNGKEKGVYLFN